MSEVLQTNIFFIITSVAVLILTIFLAFILYYVWKIVKNAKDISDKLRVGSEVLQEDLREIRTEIKEEKSKSKSLIKTLFKVLMIGALARKRKK